MVQILVQDTGGELLTRSETLIRQKGDPRVPDLGESEDRSRGELCPEAQRPCNVIMRKVLSQ